MSIKFVEFFHICDVGKLLLDDSFMKLCMADVCFILSDEGINGRMNERVCPKRGINVSD